MKPCETIAARGRWARRWHALRCPECRRARAADERFWQEARLLACEQPPPELEERILARLGLESSRPAPRRRIAPMLAAAAAGGLAIAAWTWMQRPAPPAGTPIVRLPGAPAAGTAQRAVHAPEMAGPSVPAPDRKRSVYPAGNPLPATQGPDGTLRQPQATDRSRLQAASTADRPPVYGGSGESGSPLPTRPTASDLLLLNEGALAAAAPAMPTAPPAAAVAPVPLPEREPGSRVVDDLLLLNPVRVAAADDQGLASGLAAETVESDARLRQKVTVRTTFERFSEVLTFLSRATGVTLMARMEIADEPVTIWADDRPLIDVMRDLRHLRGYFWSRSRRDGQYVYALWQDVQSRAREEEEYRRKLLETRRAFEENIRRHVQALGASEEELKRIAQEDPYRVAQIKHPVVRAGYELFASLSPDQQARLTRGETPGRHRPIGDILTVFARESYAVNGGTVIAQAGESATRMAPDGDIVTLQWNEMTPAQRAIAGALLRAAASRTEGRERQAAAGASPKSVVVSLFRWGQPLFPGLSMRLDFTSSGHPWGIYSNIGVPADAQKMLGDWLRRGDYGWPELQETVNRYLGDPKSRKDPPAANDAQPADPEKPDPVLDAPISVAWELPARGGRYKLFWRETLAALHRDLGRPLVLETSPGMIEQRPGEPGVADPAIFRWEKRPLRELLRRLFADCEFHVRGEALFVTPRERVRRPYEVPRGVREFLQQLREPFTLDDMAVIARSLSPVQVAILTDYLPSVVVDQMLAAHDLLKLYGELSPAQREQLSAGLSFRAMTPAQQALFLRFAQRQRPFLEAWRLQQGELRVTTTPVQIRQEEYAGNEPKPVARALFAVRFDEEDTASFPLDLFAQPEQRDWLSIAHLVGKPFPFPQGSAHPFARNEGWSWKPVLADGRFRGKPLVILIHWPYASPYAGTAGPPAADAWARGVAERLRDTGVTVVQLTMGPAKRGTQPGSDPALPHLIRAVEPGDANGQPFDSLWVAGAFIYRAPAVFVVSSDETVKAVFEGQDAWNTAAIERAAREMAAPQKP